MSEQDSYVDPLDQIQGDFVTTRQAADILHIPIKTVTQWCRTGLIASRRLGGRYRIPKWVVRNLRHVRIPPPPSASPYVKLADAARIFKHASGGTATLVQNRQNTVPPRWNPLRTFTEHDPTAP